MTNLDVANLLTDCAQLLDAVKAETPQTWSVWDQGVRDRITLYLREHHEPSVRLCALHKLPADECGFCEECERVTDAPKIRKISAFHCDFGCEVPSHKPGCPFHRGPENRTPPHD